MTTMRRENGTVFTAVPERGRPRPQHPSNTMPYVNFQKPFDASESLRPRTGALRGSPEFASGMTRGWLLLAPLLLAVTLASAFSANEHRTTVTLKADGSCVIRSESVEPRFRAEQQVRSWEKMKQANHADEDGDDPPTPPEEKEIKPYTDADLVKKLRESLEERNEQAVGAAETKLESVDATSNSVRTVTSLSFSSLEAMLGNPYLVWGHSGLSFESLRFEMDAGSHLRVTLTPPPDAARWTKNLRAMWRMNGFAGELRFVFPGKVLTSGLPGTAGDATWVSLDARKEETLDAAFKLYDGPTVITAEPAELKLDTPLDSKVLGRQAGRGGPELPLTDAGPGFVAEPLRVTVTTLHYFSEDQKHLKEARSAFGNQATGVVVHAKFFSPKGRTLQSVSGVRVLKAVDDKGRPITVPKAGAEASESMSYSAGDRGQMSSTQIQLHLPLPAADAQSIEQLDAEAIAVTVGSWKTMTVTNVTGQGTNGVDLAGVLPGAMLRITKVTSKNRWTILQAQIKGPPAIRQLDVQVKTGDRQNSNSSLPERSFKTKGAESTRSFTLRTPGFDANGGELQGTVSIVVRHPVDQKRERVKFTLKGMDLL